MIDINAVYNPIKFDHFQNHNYTQPYYFVWIISLLSVLLSSKGQ